MKEHNKMLKLFKRMFHSKENNFISPMNIEEEDKEERDEINIEENEDIDLISDDICEEFTEEDFINGTKGVMDDSDTHNFIKVLIGDGKDSFIREYVRYLLIDGIIC
jgi:hypothetical protein